MSKETFTKFTKEPYSNRKRATLAKIVDRVSMSVGGGEGFYEAKKYYIVLQFSSDQNPVKKFSRKFVSKDYEHLNWSDVFDVIDAYDTARTDGFPVPSTTRFYETEDRQPAILITDMTESGKYRVWGFNDKAHKSEDLTLEAMNLDGNDLNEIERQGDFIVALANSKKRSLGFQNLHIRQNISTKKIDLFLPDLDERFLEYCTFEKENMWALNQFMKILEIGPEKWKEAVEL